MPNSRFSRVSIAGIACRIPNIKKCIDDEVELFGGNIKQINRIKKTIGLNVRYVADANTTAADLCEHSALCLMDAGIVARTELGALICVTQTPDYFQPSNAAYLHGRLELSEDCACFDVNLKAINAPAVDTAIHVNLQKWCLFSLYNAMPAHYYLVQY